MKILALGDLHARDSRPRNRTDAFVETFKQKLMWCLNFGSSRGCDYVALPGDVFNGVHVSDRMKSFLVMNLRHSDSLAVAGQHDMRHRSRDLSNTPLGLLAATESISLLTNRPDEEWCDIYSEIQRRNYVINGAGFGEGLPPAIKGIFNILITHRMIVKRKKIWPGQEEFVTAKELLETSGYDLIISGDNHKAFVVQHGGRTLINCGSLMREKANQYKHQPIAVVYDTETRECEVKRIPIKPPEEVFDTERIKEVKAANGLLEEFTAALIEDGQDVGLNFKKNLRAFMTANSIDQYVRRMVWKAVEEKE